MKVGIILLWGLSISVFFSSCHKDNVANSSPDHEYFNYTLDGVAFHFEPVIDTITVAYQPDPVSVPSRVAIVCMRWIQSGPPGGFILNCTTANAQPGTYPSIQPAVVWGQGTSMTIPDHALQVTLRSFAANIGEYFEGSFTGSFTEQGTTHTLSGSFYLKRNY